MKNWYKRGSIAIVALTLLCGPLAYCSYVNPRFMDRFDDYVIVDSVHDQATGLYIELGALKNYSSLAYQVAVYPDRPVNRKSSELNEPIFWITSPQPDLDKLEFDGSCYFVRTEFKPGWTGVNSPWIDPANGKQVCFYLQNADGKKYSSVAQE